MILFTPLAPGTIRDLFSEKRNTPVSKRRPFDPLGLPSIKGQCVHVEAEELTEGVTHIRCVNDAVLGRHGWLCEEHRVDQVIASHRRQEYRDKDAEIVAGILAYESRALRNVTREVVRVGAKVKIEYVRLA